MWMDLALTSLTYEIVLIPIIICKFNQKQVQNERNRYLADILHQVQWKQSNFGEITTSTI
jgi:hypothetical protein